MGLFSSEMDALNLRFEDEFLGIIAAMMFVSASFIVNASRDGFEAVDERLESVARSLGASRLEAIFTVTIPLSLPSIVTGIVLSWARAVSEFGAVVIIAYFPKIVPTLIYEKTLRSGLSEAMPVAALLILICVGVFILLRTFTAIWKRRMEGME
jgi:molybdate/tungstate transport system permease protein